MIDYLKITKRHMQASLDAIEQAAANQNALQLAIHLIIGQLSQNSKLLLCGNGGSAADAQHFSAELVGRFELEKIALPAIALNADGALMTALSNDYGYTQVFAKQVEALGNEGDILVAISTSGNSENVIQAIKTAQLREMRILAMVGKDGGKIAQLLGAGDVLLCAPADKTAHIQEIHGIWIHAICTCLDATFQKNAGVV